MGAGSMASAVSWPAVLAVMIVATSSSGAAEGSKRVLVLYPVSDGQPGILRFDNSLRSSLRSRPDIRVEIYNEYLDSARFPDERHRRQLAEFLREKYSDRRPDVIIPALAPSLDFVLAYRDDLFPGVPVVYGAIDQREVEARKLAQDVVGVPMSVALAPTLELALRFHPGTRRVFVVAGRSKTDAYWAGEARRAFRGYERKVEFVYLTGLPMNDLLRRVAALPGWSVIYYLHLFEDGLGNTFVPADVVGPLSAAANAPVYGHFDTYVGRGIVGGRVASFEAEGANAAKVAARILAGETPESIAPAEPAATPHLFDWRELRRWGIAEGGLPSGSVILNRPPSFWVLYKWRIICGTVLCLAEALLIVALLVERASRRRTEEVLRSSQRELRALTGRLIQAQEMERRRIALELHDDLNQSLALLAVELDLIAQGPSGPGAPHDGRLRELSSRVKQLSSAVHDLSHQLHPTKLEQLGLVAALRSLCGELGRAHGLGINLSAEAEMTSIPDDIALCLYRITQEALRNVIKHGGARHARVELGSSPDAVTLRISDDGSGFDPASAAGKGGLGLVSMRERLRLIGGEIAVDSRPSGGARIEVRIPLGAPDDGRRTDEGRGEGA
jgi:signal transduction histidine kinase